MVSEYEIVHKSESALKPMKTHASPKMIPGLRNRPSITVVSRAAPRVAMPTMRLSAPKPGKRTMSQGTVKTNNQRRPRVKLRIDVESDSAAFLQWEANSAE